MWKNNIFIIFIKNQSEILFDRSVCTIFSCLRLNNFHCISKTHITKCYQWSASDNYQISARSGCACLSAWSLDSWWHEPPSQNQHQGGFPSLPLSPLVWCSPSTIDHWNLENRNIMWLIQQPEAWSNTQILYGRRTQFEQFFRLVKSFIKKNWYMSYIYYHCELYYMWTEHNAWCQ